MRIESADNLPLADRGLIKVPHISSRNVSRVMRRHTSYKTTSYQRCFKGMRLLGEEHC